jgi:hypothetical protein
VVGRRAQRPQCEIVVDRARGGEYRVTLIELRRTGKWSDIQLTTCACWQACITLGITIYMQCIVEFDYGQRSTVRRSWFDIQQN